MPAPDGAGFLTCNKKSFDPGIKYLRFNERYRSCRKFMNINFLHINVIKSGKNFASIETYIYQKVLLVSHPCDPWDASPFDELHPINPKGKQDINPQKNRKLKKRAKGEPLWPAPGHVGIGSKIVGGKIKLLRHEALAAVDRFKYHPFTAPSSQISKQHLKHHEDPSPP